MRPDKKRIDAAAKRGFLAGLRAGLKRDEAAAQAGFTANAFYYARRGDPIFALAWAWAADLSAADAHAARAAAAPFDPDAATIAPNANRRLQLRPIRRALFDDRRKRIYLDHFAATADGRAAAAAAGVAPCTVSAHRRTDPEFAAAEDEALAVAYASLEAEAVRQRLEAQRNLREGLCPTGEIAREFDRVIRLLARYERKNGRIGLRAPGVGWQRRMSFDDAIALFDRKLRVLGVRRGLIPPAALPPPPAKDDESEEEK